MDQQLIIRLDKATKNKLTKIARSEGKNTSGVVRELIQDYIANRDMSEHIADLWDQIGQQMLDQGITEEKIAQTLREVRDQN